MPNKHRGFTLVELLVVIVIIGILAALLLPAIARAIKNAKITRCVNNLVQLHKMMHNYMVDFGGPDHFFPTETCGAFWLKLAQTTPPMIDPTLAASTTSNIYSCPVEGSANAVGTTDFRGPNGNINDMSLFSEGDVIGADKPANHGTNEGGNVIRKSGDCMTVPASDQLWTLANTKTCP